MNFANIGMISQYFSVVKIYVKKIKFRLIYPIIHRGRTGQINTLSTKPDRICRFMQSGEKIIANICSFCLDALLVKLKFGLVSI